jgi:hypothetical protein
VFTFKSHQRDLAEALNKTLEKQEKAKTKPSAGEKDKPEKPEGLSRKSEKVGK